MVKEVTYLHIMLDQIDQLMTECQNNVLNNQVFANMMNGVYQGVGTCIQLVSNPPLAIESDNNGVTYCDPVLKWKLFQRLAIPEFNPTMKILAMDETENKAMVELVVTKEAIIKALESHETAFDNISIHIAEVIKHLDASTKATSNSDRVKMFDLGYNALIKAAIEYGKVLGIEDITKMTPVEPEQPKFEIVK